MILQLRNGLYANVVRSQKLINGELYYTYFMTICSTWHEDHDKPFDKVQVEKVVSTTEFVDDNVIRKWLKTEESFLAYMVGENKGFMKQPPAPKLELWERRDLFIMPINLSVANSLGAVSPRMRRQRPLDVKIKKEFNNE